ncbi:MAG TPA: hypothetical protein VLI04_01575 [Nocardioidaceae bacterium]|nr:hypothetical protein [Nocardioidaceae bacterium]
MTDLPPREVDRLETAIKELTGALDRHRVEGAATYVRKDVLDPTLLIITQALANVQEKVATHSSHWTWLMRAVGLFVLLGVLGASFVVSGGELPR